jgi:transposase
VLDRGIASADNLKQLRDKGQSFLVGTPRTRLGEFEEELCTADWKQVRESVEVKCVARDGENYVLARSRQRRRKERAIRHRQLVGAREELRKLAETVRQGRLGKADKVLERVGRIRERWPAASSFLDIQVQRDERGRAAGVKWTWKRDKLRTMMARDGAYLLLSDQMDWSAEKLWSTYIQLTRAEEAFRAMKSDLLLRPMWHHHERRVQAHIFVCVLAYVLWKALEHRLRDARAMTRIRKKDQRWGQASPQDRPMSPAVALRMMHDIQIGDILLKTTDGREIRLRRVARPMPEQAELLAWLGMDMPERLRPDDAWPVQPMDVSAPGQM